MNCSVFTKNPCRVRRNLALLCALFSFVVFGCQKSDGPPRYEVTGKVTYGGQPVPAGHILFEPLTSQGNSGPGSVADIHDGAYRTRAGQGVVGGPHQVTIFGTDGTVATETRDNALFPPRRLELDLPRANVRHDFELPGVTPGDL